MEDQSEVNKGPPPPPPPIASLNLAPPQITQHAYVLHYERKHQRIINGEQEYSNMTTEVDSKLKGKFSAAEKSSHETEATGEGLLRNLELCQKCERCGHWIENNQMRVHMTFHVAYVLDRLLLGDKHSAASHKELFVRNKVTHILNSAAELKNNFEEQGIIYLKLKLCDQIGEPVVSEALRGAEFIDQALREGGTVFVHCAMGQSRSVSCILMYLMVYRGMSYADGLQLVRQSRPMARPNLSYQQQLQQFWAKRVSDGPS